MIDIILITTGIRIIEIIILKIMTETKTLEIIMTKIIEMVKMEITIETIIKVEGLIIVIIEGH